MTTTITTVFAVIGGAHAVVMWEIGASDVSHIWSLST